jgi:hypothetical protein
LLKAMAAPVREATFAICLWRRFAFVAMLLKEL